MQRKVLDLIIKAINIYSRFISFTLYTFAEL